MELSTEHCADGGPLLVAVMNFTIPPQYTNLRHYEVDNLALGKIHGGIMRGVWCW